jgi:hypothetical protein
MPEQWPARWEVIAADGLQAAFRELVQLRRGRLPAADVERRSKIPLGTSPSADERKVPSDYFSGAVGQ